MAKIVGYAMATMEQQHPKISGKRRWRRRDSRHVVFVKKRILSISLFVVGMALGLGLVVRAFYS